MNNAKFIIQAILACGIGIFLGAQLSNLVPDFSDTPKNEVIKSK